MKELKDCAIGCVLVFIVAGSTAQSTKAVQYSTPQRMPQDRDMDSYAIYSDLLPGHEIEWDDVPRTFWLLESTTKAEPLGTSCSTSGMMNPHQAIRAPEKDQSSLAEMLGDFDRSCHERYQLEASRFRLKLPIRLLDEEGQKRYAAHVSGYMPPSDNIMQAPPTPEEFKGAAGLHSFTAVYFNRAHTMAMTEIGMYCGGLCGNWRWVVLEHRDGRWVILPWAVMTMMS